jgi:hypothetical protein
MMTDLLNQIEGSGFFSDRIFKNRFRQEWIPVTDITIEYWRKELVPHDL